MVIAEVFERRLTVALIWLALAAAGIYLFVFEPGRSGFFLACPFRTFTGFTCPGCGATRGLHQLLHGNLGAGFILNPLLVLSLPFLLYALLRYSHAVLAGRPLRRNALRPQYIYTIFGIIVFFWIFRNTPYYPFPS